VRPDRIAPSAKPPAVRQLSATPMMTKRITPTRPMVMYWRLRYAFAPAWMAWAISCIRALPAGLARIQLMEMTP
jgi:hypothetical protein